MFGQRKSEKASVRCLLPSKPDHASSKGRCLFPIACHFKPTQQRGWPQRGSKRDQRSILRHRDWRSLALLDKHSAFLRSILPARSLDSAAARLQNSTSPGAVRGIWRSSPVLICCTAIMENGTGNVRVCPCIIEAHRKASLCCLSSPILYLLDTSAARRFFLAVVQQHKLGRPPVCS
jgi:hypothetical protein